CQGAVPWGSLPRFKDKIGGPGKRDANAIYEMRIKTERPVKEKTPGRELLVERPGRTGSPPRLTGSSAIREGLSEPGPSPLVGTFRPLSPRLRDLHKKTHRLRGNAQ